MPRISLIIEDVVKPYQMWKKLISKRTNK